MAISYLNEGAVSLAAANWSDTIGFATDATLVINKGAQTITTSLDWSALGNSSGGIESLDILAPFSGNIYGTSFAPLIVDVDGQTETATTPISRLRYWASGGVMYYSANGGGAGCQFLQVGGGGQFNLVDGAVKNCHFEGAAELNVNQSATFAASGHWQLSGNKSFIDSHASNTIPRITINSGTHLIQRGFTATTGRLDVNGGSVTIDIASGDIPILNINGGTVRIISATFGAGSVLTLNGGHLDHTNLSRAITYTSATCGPAAKITNRKALVTFTSMVPVGTGPQGL